MRYTALDSVQQGDFLGRPIYSSDGRVLLEEGAQVTVGILSRLRRMGVNAIYLKDDYDAQLDYEEELVSESTKRDAIYKLSESYQFIQSQNDTNMKGISQMTKNLLDEILQNKDVLANLSEIRTEDNGLYVHSFNVTIMSVLVAIKMGMKRSDIYELAIGALFHDLGKVIQDGKFQIPYGEKGDPNDHTWKGYNFLRTKHEINTKSAHVALQHHENIDGTGYPRQLEAEAIHPFAKIVAVANFYDNLIANEKLHPFEAGERMMALTNHYFDHDVVWQFLRSIAFYPTGSQVRLSTNQIGVISGQNKGLPQRPIVHLFDTQHTNSFGDYEVREVDLSKKTTVFIDAVL